MTEQRSRLGSIVKLACSIALLVSVLPANARATEDQDRDDATLVGTWRETVSFPGVPIEFVDLIAFHEDGTLTERLASPVDGPALSTSIGVWKSVGRRTFAAVLENFSDTDGDGLWDVRFRIRLTFRLVDRNTLTGTATSDTLSVDGTTQFGPSFPGITIQGTRMRVIRE
jgi:hypothetical protein